MGDYTKVEGIGFDNRGDGGTVFQRPGGGVGV